VVNGGRAANNGKQHTAATAASLFKRISGWR
jgi:hypothetical protein